jgi:hypothetical protein
MKFIQTLVHVEGSEKEISKIKSLYIVLYNNKIWHEHIFPLTPELMHWHNIISTHFETRVVSRQDTSLGSVTLPLFMEKNAIK